MIDWVFHIDDLEIGEPLGFSDVVIRAKRDENLHGIFFEASTSDLTFYGEAARYLQEKKRLLGFAAEVNFRAVAVCGQENDVLSGRLDFRRYKSSCGNECMVTLPVEMEGCTMTLRNRYDQKVDLSSNKAFDGMTVLPNYSGLNFPMDLPAQELKAAVEGYVVDEGDVVDLEIFPGETQHFWVRPTYGRALYESINESQLAPSVFAGSDNGLNDFALSPIVLLDDTIECFDGTFNYQIRIKGSYDYTIVRDTPISNFDVQGFIKVGYGSDFNALTELHSETLFSHANMDAVDLNGTFDFTYSGTVDLTTGEGFHIFFSSIATEHGDLFGPRTITFDKETYINIYANKACPDTEAVVSLIHETAARITEAITDKCLTVKSDYYGRTDSEPYAASADGCGSLRVLSSGLRIRKAENPTHFMSLKDLFDGLNPIDNIGMGIEGSYLRIEPTEYFYQDTEIIRMPSIPKAETTADDSEAYSIVKVGYKKWETEGVNGLDEFNSNKEFRTSLKNISNTLDITSNFIAGGYPIEHTRQQSFADSGGADTKYDNDTFIICVTKSAYGYDVEQGNVINAANMYSPSTVYNWRIRPFYNLMRWWKSIAQSYANLANTESKIIFSAGTGNIEAEGELSTTYCKLEGKVKAENDDLLRNDFSVMPSPIWKPDNIKFTYPMSLREFNLVKANPYGYVFYQCGDEFKKAFIMDLLYKPSKGEADLTLRLKWDT